MDDQFVDFRIIKLENGSNIELKITEKFSNLVKKHYNLNVDQNVTDDQYKDYILNSVKSAKDKLL